MRDPEQLHSLPWEGHKARDLARKTHSPNCCVTCFWSLPLHMCPLLLLLSSSECRLLRSDHLTTTTLKQKSLVIVSIWVAKVIYVAGLQAMVAEPA